MIITSPGRGSAFQGVCRIKVLFLCGLSLALLNSAGCDFVSSASPFSSQNTPATQSANAPQPLVIPQGQGSLVPPSPSSSDGLQSTDMAGPLGLNTKRLFEEPIKDDDKRFDRLENSVQNLRDEFDSVTPSIQRLMDIEKDIQNLVEELENLLAEDPGPAPAAAAPQSPPQGISGQQGAATQPPQALGSPTPPPEPTPVTKTKPQTAKPSMPVPVKATGAKLGTIRMADHSGKTRIVLEAGEKLDFTADLDNAENLMTLIFNNGSLGLDVSSVKKTSKLVKSVSGTPQDNGFILAFTLGKSSSILKQGYIPPNKDNPNHRFFIDLAR